MKKKLQISIPTACHENWNEMTPVEKGRFCGSCSKQVIDFSNMSDRQIAQFFKKPSTGSVCGRFMPDQLDRDIEMPKKRIPWLRYFFQIALPALFFTKASGQNQKPTKMDRHAGDSIRYNTDQEMRTLGMILPRTIVPAEVKKQDTITRVVKPVEHRVSIKGRVVNEMGEPIPFASIEAGNKGVIAVADEQGAFCVPVKSLDADSMLLVSSVGFKDQQVQVDKEDAVDSELNIQLNTLGELEGVVLNAGVMGLIRCSVMGSVSIVHIDKPETVIKEESILPAVVRAYPNPVRPGANISISCTQYEKGNYSIQLLNLAGQLVHRKELPVDGEASTITMEMPVVPPGNYFLVLTSKLSGKKFTEKIIVQ